MISNNKKNLRPQYYLYKLMLRYENIFQILAWEIKHFANLFLKFSYNCSQTIPRSKSLPLKYLFSIHLLCRFIKVSLRIKNPYNYKFF